jgi:hypothetical protein
MALRGHLWVGALAGYTASRTMDAATNRYYAKQSAASQSREQEIAPGGSLVQLGRQLGQATGRDLDDGAAGRAGLAVHRTLGTTYGIIAAALVDHGMAPMKAGVLVGTAAFLLVDEGTAIPTATDYPLVSHGRGVVGHGTFGLVCGFLLWLTGVGRRGT